MISMERFQFLCKQIKDIFDDESFHDPKNAELLLAEMPNRETHQDLVDDAIHLIDREGVSSILVACYHGALLTEEQEQHLFRKYNFLKFQMKQLLEGPYIHQRWRRYEKADNILKEVIAVRNFIVVCNLRLAPSQVTKYALHLQNMLIEDGYSTVLKCVPKFDWRKGYKFSTYTIWAMQNNFKRCFEIYFRYKSRNEQLVVDEKTEALAVTELPWDEIDQREENDKLTSYVNQLDDKRERFVLKAIYGLGGHKIISQPELAKHFKVFVKFIQELRRRAICKIRAYLGIEEYQSYRQLKKARQVA